MVCIQTVRVLVIRRLSADHIQGSAVAMPWVQDVNGVVQAWYSGNEVGNALADVLYGIVNPSGRLSLTLPVRIEGIPPYPYLHSENGEINYREDLFVGYKYYQAKAIKPLFPFGCVPLELSFSIFPIIFSYGLSYTTFAISDLVLRDASSHDEHFSIKAGVKLANSGDVCGSCVVQLYISLPGAGVTIPGLQLKGRTDGAPKLACTMCTSGSTVRSYPFIVPLSSRRLSGGVACRSHVIHLGHL